ncbi:hypothetical protein L3Y34_001750 [Caenorhabditis briggsae]|uniref:SHSP domain-containing protein n=2 Tax=Caenorhabditis briggsae TaxID=6238 RepID=A0AAE9IQT0_CAEBR|nr:hypothetical protein L3Y34_001750 [Caenorhabditis briggsae]
MSYSIKVQVTVSIPSKQMTGRYQSGFHREPQKPFIHPSEITERRPRSPGPVAGAGEITNTSHGFTIEIDVFHFLPEEIKVVLTDDTLSISGERFESTGDGHTLRRSFSRKYSIPEDVHLDTIRSHLTNSGVLIINGSRKGWRETSISTYQPAQRHVSRSVTSIV